MRSTFTLGLTALLIAWTAPMTSQADPDEMTWRRIEPENLVLVELKDGQFVLELNSTFAPATVAQFKRLVREDFYRGLSFYRVIEGFVAQGGDESDIGFPSKEPTIGAEFEIDWRDELPWTRVEKNDAFGAETGFMDGFAAARHKEHAWLTHCPGVIAMARATDTDSSRTDFYIVIGQAPRYLDRNLNVFGRVIEGMDSVQRIRRGPIRENGVIEKDLERSRIRRMHVISDLPIESRKEYLVMDTRSKGFKTYMEERRKRQDDFFAQTPPPVLDVCQLPVQTRVHTPPQTD